MVFKCCVFLFCNTWTAAIICSSPDSVLARAEHAEEISLLVLLVLATGKLEPIRLLNNLFI